MRFSRKTIILLAAALALQSCAVSKYARNADYPGLALTEEPAGELQEVFFPSSEPGMIKRRAMVYLPQGYSGSEERYPAMYLLHGARGNECTWIIKGNLLHNIDSLMAAGLMKPTIVVLPNINQYNNDEDFGKSRLKPAMEAFYEVDGTAEAHFVQDVVHTTDSLFRTIPDKEHRAVAGMSLGAMQSIYLSANHPDMFGYVGMFSPMVHSFLKPGKDNKYYSHLDAKMAVQFQDPPRLYILMIGKTDFFHPSISCWDRKLTRKGYPHEFVLAPGGHEWYNWTDFSVYFMQRLWK